MNRSKLTLSALALAFLLPACGPGEAVVTVEVDMLNAETGEREPRAIADLPVEFLPYDRDAIFDSLEAVAPSPEPMLPEALVIARDSIAAARIEWQDGEARWLALRDRMQEILNEMEDYLPAEPTYRVLFAEFNTAEGEVVRAERTKDAAFARFERLQQATFSEMEAFNVRVQAWEEEAFADWSTIVTARLRSLGLDEMADTTDATGIARLAPAPAQWWVYARLPVATDELYWNVPVTIERGVPVEVRLNRANAEVRPIL